MHALVPCLSLSLSLFYVCERESLIHYLLRGDEDGPLRGFLCHSSVRRGQLLVCEEFLSEREGVIEVNGRGSV